MSWDRYPVWPNTFVFPSADSRGAVVSYWRKYVHEVLVNRLGGLSLPRKSVVRLTYRPDMTLDVCHGRKTTTQLNNNPHPKHFWCYHVILSIKHRSSYEAISRMQIGYSICMSRHKWHCSLEIFPVEHKK